MDPKNPSLHGYLLRMRDPSKMERMNLMGRIHNSQFSVQHCEFGSVVVDEEGI